jgi:hypothetical protein
MLKRPIVVRSTSAFVIHAWSVLLVRKSGSPEEKPSARRTAIFG